MGVFEDRFSCKSLFDGMWLAMAVVNNDGPAGLAPSNCA